MVFHGSKWGWRTIAARLLLAPVLAAAAAPAAAQQPKPAQPAAASKARAADPKDLLKQGREALKAGHFDRAQDLARQADAANPSGRWGLFDDTPESLETDIRKARTKANQAEADKLTKAAKEEFGRAGKMKPSAEKLLALERAYAMADRATALQGPTDFLDDWFGDRPDKLKKEIDLARINLRKSLPPAELARVPATPPAAHPPAPRVSPPTQQAAKTGRPAGPTMPPVQQASNVAKPAGPITPPPSLVKSPVVPAGATVPAAQPTAPAAQTTHTAEKAAAAKLLADGRTLLKDNKLAAARAKAAEAQKLNARYGPADDTPDALLRDILADGKKQIDDLVRKSDEHLARRDTIKAEFALTIALQMSAELAIPTKPVEEKLAMVKRAATAVAAATPPASPAAPATGPAAPPAAKMPDPPKAIVVPSVAQAAPPGPKPADPVVVPAAPKGPEVAGVGKPVIPPSTPAAPGATAQAAPSPLPNLAMPTPPAAEHAAVGLELLESATRELKRGDLEAARKLATRAHNGEYGGKVKADAQALLREIDAEDFGRKKREATASFRNAAESFNAKQYEQALGVLKLIDPANLDPQDKAKYQKLMDNCSTELAKLKSPVTPAGGSDPAKPTAPATPGLTDQVKALNEVQFQQLRSEGLEVQTKAQEAFNRGDTNLAIQMLTDFSTKVRSSSLSAGRQSLLLGGVDRRLETFRIMKRQIDFVVNEAKDKKEARERIVGRSVAEQQKKEEIAKKVREVEALAKAHKYREAEALALQVKTLDPDDPTLNAVYSLAKRQRAVDDYQKIKDSKEDLFRRGLNGAEQQGPLVDIDNPIAGNTERALRAMQRGDGSDVYLKTRTAGEREIELRLDKPLNLEVQNAPLTEVLDEVRKKTGLNITTDTASITDEQIPLDAVTITENLKALSVRNVLTIVLDKARLKFVVENDVVKITTEKKAKGRMVTKVFSVMDLVTPIPDFALADFMSFDKAVQRATNPLPGWANTPSGARVLDQTGAMGGGQLVSQPHGMAGQPGASPIPASGYGTIDNRTNPLASSARLADSPRANMSAQLMKLVTGMVRPYSWQEMGGPGKIDYYDIGGALVVNQTADVIREVQDLLESLRRLQETSVAVEIRVISLSEQFFERVGVDFSMNISTLSKKRLQFEQALTTGQFRPEPFINSIDGVGKGVTVGYNPAMGGFTPDLDVPIRATSYPLSVPPFGGYDTNGLSPVLNGGLGVGLAFLNDIQVFMFLEAAQGDRRVNIMQAPKITLFNGQTSTVFVSDVAFFTLGLQVYQVGNQFVYLPQNVPIPIGNNTPPPGVQTGGQPGVSVTVQAIVSSDRRFVRMNLSPVLTALTSATVPLFPVTAFITPVFEGGSQGVPIPFTQFFQQPSVTHIAVQTTVAVPDGGTVVMGGLKTLAEGRNEFGPPVLSDIPYLNRLFRNQGIGRETRHIMLMVTPRIIIQSEEEFNQTGAAPGFIPGAVPPGGAP